MTINKKTREKRPKTCASESMSMVCDGASRDESCGQGPVVRCLKFGPELNDGHSPWIVHPRYLQAGRSQGLLESLKLFLSECDVGDTTEVEVIEMLEFDYERMPLL